MRHWSERMGPGFGMSRPNQQQQQQQQQQQMNMHVVPPPHHAAKPPMGPGQHGQAPLTTGPELPIHLSFNVPFSSDLEGPIIEDIVHATPEAGERWTHPESAPEDVKIHDLPVHQTNVHNLKKLCKEITSGPLPIEAHVITSVPRRTKGRQVVNVCLTGSPELVTKTRETIMNETPLSLVCTSVQEPWLG